MIIDVGIDPDIKGHGFAQAIDKKMVACKRMKMMQIHAFILANTAAERITFHIEHVHKKKAIFRKRGVYGAKQGKEVARCVGLNQQSCVDLIEMIESLNMPNVVIKLHGISSNWKNAYYGNRKMLQVWNWTKITNPDTRSAAYFLTNCL